MNAKLQELDALITDGGLHPDVEKAAKRVIKELGEFFDTTMDVVNEYRKRAWAAEDAVGNDRRRRA